MSKVNNLRQVLDKCPLTNHHLMNGNDAPIRAPNHFCPKDCGSSSKHPQEGLMPNYTKHTPSRGSDSMPQKERYLTDKHGDLHQVIPEMLESRTQYEVAKELSDTVVYVSQAWVSDWLRGGNAAGTVYRQKRRWVPVGEAS